MSLILHISDLHLGTRASLVDDHKVGLVPSPDRLRTLDVLVTTFRQLSEHLINEGRTLHSIVVSGDVADKNSEDGYADFITLLDALGSVRPRANRIVVVPGNHDVTSGLRPGNPKRYETFVKYIRAAGFITPLLAGIDARDGGSLDRGRHLLQGDGIEIIPIDSAAYSQITIDTGISDAAWDKLESVLRATPADLSALQRLRVVDAARVDDRYFEPLRSWLTPARGDIGTPLRIAVLHHQLLPVGTREEIKPFESLSNLGLVRDFFAQLGVSVVLHGHKHHRFAYLDYVSPFNADSLQPALVRVLSGAAAVAIDTNPRDILRLIDVDPRGASMNVTRVGAARPGGRLPIGEPERLTIHVPGFGDSLASSGCKIVDGPAVDAVYNQMLTLFAAPNTEVSNLLCRIENFPEISDLARLYPGTYLPGIQDDNDEPELATRKREELFREVVEWWQMASAPAGRTEPVSFTHGSRIKRYSGYFDQVAASIEAIRHDPRTSRGVIVLLNPVQDRVADGSVPFPSFCLVQFTVAGPSLGAPPILACAAYFRKQEVRYWWLVNLAEIAQLQKQVCDALRADRDIALRDIRPGAITMFAARAHAGSSAPKVQVPRLDRYYALSREHLFALVHALFWENMPERERWAGEWLRLFLELIPPEERDPDGIPIARDGLEYLAQEVARHISRESPSGEWQVLLRALEQLLSANRQLALDQQKDQITSTAYNNWRAVVTPLIQTIIEASYGRIIRTT